MQFDVRRTYGGLAAQYLSAVSFLIVAWLWTPCAWAGPPKYRVTPLRTPDGYFSGTPRAINDFGQVVGVMQFEEQFNYRAYLWNPDAPNGDSGSMIDLGVPPGRSYSSAIDINSQGQIVGGGGGDAPFLWTPTTPNGNSGHWIGLTAPPGNPAVRFSASSINDHGQIAGTGHLPTPGRRAYLWNPTNPGSSTGTYIDLASQFPEPYSSEALAINNAGEVVGTINVYDGAFLWKPDVPNGVIGESIRLWPTLPDHCDPYYTLYTNGVAINSNGDFAGNMEVVVACEEEDVISQRRAYVWSPDEPNGLQGDVAVLDAIPSARPSFQLYAMNDARFAVGHVHRFQGSDHMFLSTPDDGMHDVNDLLIPSDAGWEVFFADDINNRNQIVGTGRFDPPPGDPRPFFYGSVLLSPVIEGDLDDNGVVDRADLALIVKNYGRSGGVDFYDGDFSGDGLVGLADLVTLQRNFTPDLSVLESRAVPEPNSLWLTATLLVTLSMMRAGHHRLG